VPILLPDTWTGDALRQVREARGLSVQQIADRTKVTRHHIENIEGDRFASLPPQVYLRGILLALARELRLDGQKVARSYIERLASGGGAPKPR
jgi:cytoskeletal protein RodZ